MRTLRGRGRFLKKRLVKKTKSMDPIFFAFNIADDLISWNKNELKKNDPVSLISFDDAYNYYFKFCNSKSYKFIISKRYFEKYLYSKISEHIVYEKFIETDWLINS